MSPYRRSRIYLITAWLIGVTAVGLLPVGLDGWAQLQTARPLGMTHWVHALLFVAMLQLAYAIYLTQVPDWSSLWVVTIMMLALASTYAMLMCLRLLAGDGNRLLQLLELHVNQFSAAQEAGWCFIMLLLTGLFSYFTGRIAAVWHHDEAFV